MQFDPSFTPNRDKLEAHIAALMDRTFYRNRANGFNVQFINQDHLDEWSFRSRDRAEVFAKSLNDNGIATAFSA